MNIAELARRANVTPRTIRYYVEQGLLPTPGRGRIAEYSEEHLSAIHLIQRLKGHYLPLDEIRDTLQRLTQSEIEDLLKDGEPQESKEKGSASDYIAGVLDRGIRRQKMKEQAPPPYQSYAPPARSQEIYNSPPTPLSALPPGYVAPPAPGAHTPSKMMPVDYAAPSAAPPTLAPAMSADAVPHTQGGTVGDETGTWQRIALSTDIELHYRVPAHTHTQTLVARLLSAFGQMLKDITEKDGGK